MPAKKKAKLLELPEDVIEGINKMAERFGTTFTFEAIDALRRHIAYPPERKPEPLPPAADSPPPKPRRKKAP